MQYVANLLGPQIVINHLPSKVSQRVKIITKNLSNVCQQLVRDKQAEMISSYEQGDMISTLIRTDNFSDERLVDQMLMFLAASDETTSSALVSSNTVSLRIESLLSY